MVEARATSWLVVLALFTSAQYYTMYFDNFPVVYPPDVVLVVEHITHHSDYLLFDSEQLVAIITLLIQLTNSLSTLGRVVMARTKSPRQQRQVISCTACPSQACSMLTAL